MRSFANDIEILTCRAYAHMPPDVQSELAKDQLIRALLPIELRMHIQLEHQPSLQAALELAVEREIVWGKQAMDGSRDMPTVRGAAEQGKPTWVAEITELIRAVSLQPARNTRASPRLCWGCGQPGHLRRQCPQAPWGQGNSTGSA